DMLVIGRSVTAAEQPDAAAVALFGELLPAVSGR
ncbi:MAG: hypothetical protein QOJ19_4444, partial [Acidimicrobiia bacterium]|nr:hypothetical protein [Acidimicrobiia bacterium]